MVDKHNAFRVFAEREGVRVIQAPIAKGMGVIQARITQDLPDSLPVSALQSERESVEIVYCFVFCTCLVRFPPCFLVVLSQILRIFFFGMYG